MSKLLNFLNENKHGQIATIKNNKPVMRPFQFVFEKDGKFYFLTSNTKDVYRQLIASGVAGFAVLGKDMSWARLSGEVQFVDSLELKEEALNSTPMIRGIYKTADNPVFEMFYIHRGVASLHKGAGELVEEMEIQYGGEPYYKDQVIELSKEVQVPLIAVGGIRSKEAAQELINYEHIEAVSFSRPFICDPDLVHRWKKGEKARCTTCSQCGGPNGIKCIQNN